MDADESRGGSVGVALRDLVRDAPEHSPDVRFAEHDLLVAFVHSFLPGLTGPG
jgi:hypothetical protein